MSNRTCLECGSELPKHRGKSCSDECSRSRDLRRKRELYHSRYAMRERRADANYTQDKKCDHCRIAFSGKPAQKFCSKACQFEGQVVTGMSRRRPPVYSIRQAVDACDYRGFIELIRERVTLVDGCWVWNGYLDDGYPNITVAGKSLRAHRLVLEMKHGAPLGVQHAHHICANSACVNPDHLQPVSHRENAAEMLARGSFVARIAELEAALREVVPGHPVLDRVEFAA